MSYTSLSEIYDRQNAMHSFVYLIKNKGSAIKNTEVNGVEIPLSGDGLIPSDKIFNQLL